LSWKSNITKTSPVIVKAVNFSDETVLHWIAVENNTATVQILIELGSPIPEYALAEAWELWGI
tara:strand:- start:65 stop:253 length:189 start_codon:yes stop_codon:yes gene_type:complete